MKMQCRRRTEYSQYLAPLHNEMLKLSLEAPHHVLHLPNGPFGPAIAGRLSDCTVLWYGPGPLTRAFEMAFSQEPLLPTLPSVPGEA